MSWAKACRGTIGIIGPKRMDYEKVVDTLKTLMNQLDEIFNKNKEGSVTNVDCRKRRKQWSPKK